jgi:hypothetical protein
VFVFNKDDSYDTVWDFNASEGDKIRLDPALGVVTLADLQNPSLAPHSTARITPSSRWRRRQ